jgi:hypothetical protein
MRLLALLALVLVLGATACGEQTEKLYSLAKTRSCLADDGVRLGGKLDFVATTATGGALKAHLGSNFVTVVFGETVADADNINQAYHTFREQNVGIEDVLRQQSNAVMLWHEHPSDAATSRVTGCLR